MIWVTKAARNNAFWCDAVCRLHGAPGTFYDSIWLTRHETPSFYPNAVTLTGAEDAEAQTAHIQSLLEAGIPGNWAVKDSFAALDLSLLGFRLLFEGQWLWRPATASISGAAMGGIHWSLVREPAELARWETAWGGGADLVPGAQPTFLPALLAEPDVVFFAGYQQQRIMAGVIANQSEGVVGVSNVFAAEDQASSAWAGAVAAVMDRFPGLPLVGYEQGEALEIAVSLGFGALSPLCVWVRDPFPVESWVDE